MSSDALETWEGEDSYTQYKGGLRRLLSDFSGQGNTLVIPRPFVDFLGGLEVALLFSQMLYWSDRTRQPERWFYKTYTDWNTELGLSEYQVRKAVKKLTEWQINDDPKPLLATEVRKAQGNPTVHYRVIWDNFSESFLHFLQERNRSNSRNEGKETSGSSNRDYNREYSQGPTPGEGFETEVSQPSPAPKGAKTAFRQNRKAQVPFTEADRERLAAKYQDSLQDVGFHIDQALNHTASNKVKSLPLYVDGWLRREAQRPARNGSAPPPAQRYVPDFSTGNSPPMAPEKAAELDARLAEIRRKHQETERAKPRP